MKWNTQRRRNASGSSFSAFDVMITTGRSLGDDLLLRLGDEEAHAVELVQQVVGELEVGLVDLVDQAGSRAIGAANASPSGPRRM